MWRLALGLVLAIVILWMLFKRKSGYKAPVYTEYMNSDELSAEFNKAAGDMSAEMIIVKGIPGNESKVAEFEQKEKNEYEKLNKEFELWKAKTVEAAAPMNEQPPAPAPAQVPSPVVKVLPEPTTTEIQQVSPPAEISPA